MIYDCLLEMLQNESSKPPSLRTHGVSFSAQVLMTMPDPCYADPWHVELLGTAETSSGPVAGPQGPRAEWPMFS